MKNVNVIIIIHYSILIHYLSFSFSQVHLAMLKSAPIQISVFPNTLLLPPLLLLTQTSSLVLFTPFFSTSYVSNIRKNQIHRTSFGYDLRTLIYLEFCSDRWSE